MIFVSKASPTAMFTFGKRRCRCVGGKFNTAGQPDEKKLIEFLTKNPNFEPAEGKAPAAPEGDGLDDLSLEELLEIAEKEKVAAPSELARVKSEETMIKKIRENRE